jgi:hypothetical protein
VEDTFTVDGFRRFQTPWAEIEPDEQVYSSGPWVPHRIVFRATPPDGWDGTVEIRPGATFALWGEM